MFRALSLVVAAAVLVVSGVIHGLMTDRWGLSPDLAAAAARLDKVPNNLGDWQGRPMEIDERQLKIAEVVGYASRRYFNRHTSREVSVLIVCGRPGPIARHEPDLCFRGLGYQPGKRYKFEPKAGGGADHFYRAVFIKPRTTPPDALRILWAWSSGGNWSAPDNPPYAFVNTKVLYKVYVIRQLSHPDESVEGDPAEEFLDLLLPELRKVLNLDS